MQININFKLLYIIVIKFSTETISTTKKLHMRIMTYCSKNSIVPGGEKDFLQAICHQTPVNKNTQKKKKTESIRINKWGQGACMETYTTWT